jgi:acetyl/propionyl-CoA carboxylase alpha subunit
LLGKLIVWGDTRTHAIRRMRRALDELAVVGVPTSQPFHRRVMDEPDFAAGDYDNGYVEVHGPTLLATTTDDEVLRGVAIAAALAEDERRAARVPTAERRSERVGRSAWVEWARRDSLRG